MIEFRPIPEPGRSHSAEGAADPSPPDGAFAEMLQRSLGKNIVRGYRESAEGHAGETGAEGNDTPADGGSVIPWPLRAASTPTPIPEAEASPVPGSEAAFAEPAAAASVVPALPEEEAPDQAGAAPLPASATSPTPGIPPQTGEPADPASLATGTSGYVAGGEMTTSTSIQLTDAGPAERVPSGPAPTASHPPTERHGPATSLHVDLAPADNPTTPSGAIETSSLPGHEVTGTQQSDRDQGHSRVTEAPPEGPVGGGPDSMLGAGPRAAEAPSITAAPPSSIPGAAAAVDRIMRVVEMRGQLPPPHRVVVELPQVDDVQVAVTVRGSTVHIASARGDAVPEVFRPLVGMLSAALAARGFTLEAEVGGRGRRHPREETAETPFTRQNVVKPRRNDDGLRI